MQITVELPEDIAVGLESKWKDLPRAALESLALEAYRSRALTAAQLRRLLGFETRMQLDAFLKEHEVNDLLQRTSSRTARRSVSSEREMLSTETALAIIVTDISPTIRFFAERAAPNPITSKELKVRHREVAAQPSLKLQPTVQQK
jgi:hypothetical protein